MLIDTHVHYDEERFDVDRDDVIKRAYSAGVHHMVNVSNCMSSSFYSVRLSHEYPYIYAAVGIHPYFAGEMNAVNLCTLRELAKDKKIVAIGEIGLDKCHRIFPMQLQKECFASQINLARELHLPIMIHNRDAHQDVFDMLDSFHAKEVGGVIHNYCGSVDMAKRFLKIGFYLSFAGPVTYHNARKLIDVVRDVPLDRILVETDSPDIPPVPFRGTRNDSTHLKIIVEKIAAIKGTTFEEVSKATTANAGILLGIQE